VLVRVLVLVLVLVLVRVRVLVLVLVLRLVKETTCHVTRCVGPMRRTRPHRLRPEMWWQRLTIPHPTRPRTALRIVTTLRTA